MSVRRPRPGLAAGALRRPWLAAALVAVVLGLAAAAALAAAPRTIVVRGRTLSPDGRPLAGARVMARGSVSVSALADERGRYSISLPLGMPAALRRLPFKVEVRAEADGRRLPLAGGGSSLVIDAAWPAAAERPRVQSNREAAETAVATALMVEGVTIAWVEADFGGLPRASATPAPEPAAAPPAPRNTVAPARPPSPAPETRQPAPTDPSRSAIERSAGVVPRAAEPVAARPPAPATKPAPADSTPPAARTSRDTAPAAAPVPRTSVPARRSPAPRDSARPRTAEPPKIVASAREVEPPPPRPSAVRAIDPSAKRDGAAPSDTCRCTIRGTVEIHWDRPLEDDTPVKLELDAPGAKPAEVTLFMGAPREFRFGPLPCGDWRLTVRPGGKLRYADVSGDSARVVPCAGATETRVVLVPVRR